MNFIQEALITTDEETIKYHILFTLAFNKSNTPMSIFDYDTNRYIDVNPAFLKAFEYKREEVIGKTTAEINMYEEPEIRDHLIESLIKTGKVKSDNLRILTKTGDRRIGSLAAEVFELNGKKYIYSVMNDLTESVSIKEAIVKRERLYRKITENISDVVVIVNKDQENTYVSPNMKRLFGIDPKNALGPIDLLSAHPEDKPLVTAFFNDLIHKGPESEDMLEIRFVRPDGNINIVEINARNLTTDPVIQGILANYHDISERRKLENKIEEEAERYHALIESSKAMIWVVDPVNFGVMTYNSTFYNYFKSERNIELKVGMKPEELVPPDYVKDWYARYQKAKDEGPFEVIYQTVTRTKYLRLSLYPMIVNGEIIGCVRVWG